MTRAALALAAIALFGVSGLAQTGAGQRIADQKAEAMVKKAISDADNLMRARPDKAVQYLKRAQSDLDLSGGISTATRKALTEQLKAKLAAAQGKPAPTTQPLAAPGAKFDPRGTAVRTDKKAVWEAYLIETKAVQDGLAKIKEYNRLNQPRAAAAVVNELASKYPGNPSVIALTRKGNFQDAVDDAHLYAKNAADRMNKAYMSVDRSSIPLGDRDVEFPKDWDRIKKRQSVNAVKLTEKEKKIIESLNKPVTIIGKDKPLDYLLQELSTAIDQPLLIDERSLRDVDIDLKSNASLEAQGISAHTALRQLLASKGLTYIIQSETIQIVTVERARESLTTKVYYLGDVTQGIGPFGGGATWGPFLDFQQTVTNVNTIVDAIQDSVDPLSWKKRGGPGTITFHYPTMSIIVRASSEVHSALGSKLGGK